MHRRSFLCAAALALLRTEPLSARRGEARSWVVSGEARRALVFPPSQWGGYAPVVLCFHGHGDDIERFQRTNLQEVWPEALVVYFQGLPTRRDGLSGWQVTRGQDNDRDLALVDTALASLRRSDRIDDSRIYATGFSNGGSFTYLLWAERPDTFAAFAPVAGRLAATVQLQRPKPVLHIAGRQDRQVRLVDQLAAIDAAKRVNGTSAPVKTWLHAGGHEWRGGSSDRIASFFRGQRRASRPR